MSERQRMTTRLKTLFRRPALFVLAGGINPIGAKMAEALGYDAFYMSGGNTSAHQLGWPDSGTSMRDMVDNARKIVLSVQIPVFADADTGYGDAISTHYTVREYIQAGIAGAHIEDQTFPPKSGPRRRCISIQEMVGKLRAAMDAKQALDPDFVIMARCDLGGVPGASFSEIIERCQAYKAEAQVDVICPNGLRTWEEIKEAIRLIPGPVVPLIPAHLSPYPSLQAQQDAGAAAAWFPALTTLGRRQQWPHSGRVASALHGGDVSSRLKLADAVPGSRRVRGKRSSPGVRGALFTAVVAEGIWCGSTRREIRRAGCCGVYPAEEARAERHQVSRRRRVVCGTVPAPWPRWWWTPQPAASKKRGCLLRGYRELALLDACQTAPSALAR